MKMKLRFFALLMAVAFCFTACANAPDQPEQMPDTQNAVDIALGETVLVDGEPANGDTEHAVYIANDIVYYEAGQGLSYGEGSEQDEHTTEEAAAHTVIHITQPGTYRLHGTLPLGQIAVDLGEDAAEYPTAVVTLLLDGVDITCEVAPAILFYNVYECDQNDKEFAGMEVDTSAAGANLVLMDGTENTIRGSYVARIYKPDSVELNDDGSVKDAKKLHKYDGAVYSRMSMNLYGSEQDPGRLQVIAENEGIDTERHLTMYGGEIRIESGNDGINTNEDGVSVTTICGGKLDIQVTGSTGEGDGIDSNGWLVIRGGSVSAFACSDSADAGIDSDMGIHILGGRVLATGHMLDRIEDGGQTYAVFRFAQEQAGGQELVLKAASGETLTVLEPQNDHSILIYSDPELAEGDYTLWSGDRQYSWQGSQMMGGPGMIPPGGEEPMPPEEGAFPGEGGQPPFNGAMPQPDEQPPEGGMAPPDMERPDFPSPPDGNTQPPDRPGHPNNGENGAWMPDGTPSEVFPIHSGANDFGNVVMS